MVDQESVTVTMFGNPVKAICYDGCVRFERETFVKAIGKLRAERIFKCMGESFEFLGTDGMEWLIANNKEHLLCGLVLADKNSPPELVEYASAWASAYELLKEKV